MRAAGVCALFDFLMPLCTPCWPESFPRLVWAQNLWSTPTVCHPTAPPPGLQAPKAKCWLITGSPYLPLPSL